MFKKETQRVFIYHPHLTLNPCRNAAEQLREKFENIIRIKYGIPRTEVVLDFINKDVNDGLHADVEAVYVPELTFEINDDGYPNLIHSNPTHHESLKEYISKLADKPEALRIFFIDWDKKYDTFEVNTQIDARIKEILGKNKSWVKDRDLSSADIAMAMSNSGTIGVFYSGDEIPIFYSEVFYVGVAERNANDIRFLHSLDKRLCSLIGPYCTKVRLLNLEQRNYVYMYAKHGENNPEFCFKRYVADKISKAETIVWLYDCGALRVTQNKSVAFQWVSENDFFKYSTGELTSYNKEMTSRGRKRKSKDKTVPQSTDGRAQSYTNQGSQE